MIILKILGGILAYLAIGLLVTSMFFNGRSVHMGAAPLVFISPLIWPVLVVSMMDEKAKKRARDKINKENQLKILEERLAACPPGYEIPFTVFYASQISNYESEYSREQAWEALLTQLLKGNLPDDPKLREEILLEIGKWLSPLKVQALYAELLPLFSAEAPPLSNYAAGVLLAQSLKYELDSSRRMEPQKLVPMLRSMIAAWDRYLELEPSALGSLSTASYYYYLAEFLPEGDEREDARRKAVALFDHSLRKSPSFSAVWNALYCLLDLGVEPVMILDGLDALLVSVQEEKRTDSYLWGDYKLLPFAWNNVPVDSAMFPRVVIEEKLLPKVPDEETAIAIASRLLPLGTASTRHFSPDRQWREVMLKPYLESGNLAWADAYLRMIEDAEAAGGIAGYGSGRISLAYCRAENAMMHGNVDEAARFLREHYINDEYRRLGVPFSGDPWTQTEEGQALKRLDHEVYEQVIEEFGGNG